MLELVELRGVDEQVEDALDAATGVVAVALGASADSGPVVEGKAEVMTREGFVWPTDLPVPSYSMLPGSRLFCRWIAWNAAAHASASDQGDHRARAAATIGRRGEPGPRRGAPGD